MDEHEQTTSSQNPQPVWCIAANVREDIPFGEGAIETRRGTRKFHAGAKVYLVGAFWGMGAENVTVIGHYRGKQYITASLQVRYLTNWRAELVYSPTVIARLPNIPPWDSFHWDGSEDSKNRAEQLVQMFSEYSSKLHNERLERRQQIQNKQDEAEKLNPQG